MIATIVRPSILQTPMPNEYKELKKIETILALRQWPAVLLPT